MKKIIAVLCFALVLSGCGNTGIGKTTNKPVEKQGLVEISRNVYCDTEYNVQYLYINSGYNAAVMSVRFDSNGKTIPCYK